MAIDFGFLNALSGTKNWDAIRNDKRAALMYQQGANQLAEQKNKENEAAAAEVQKYQQAIEDMPVLPQGLERIKALSDTLKGPIAEGIKESNGDLEKWIKTRGMVDLHNYINTIYHHPTTQKELKNAVSKAHWQADQQAGLTETLLNPDGTQRTPFGSQLQDYESGKIDSLNYGGGFKPGKWDEKFVGQTYGSANRYKPVSVRDEKEYASLMYEQLVAGGMEPLHARQQAMGGGSVYQQRLANGGPALQYKHDNWTPQDMLAMAKLKKLSEQGGAAKGISYLAGIHNNLITPDKQSADGSVRYYLPHEKDLHSLVGAAGHELNEKTGGLKTVENITARGNFFTSDFSKPVDFAGLNDKDITMTPVGAVNKPDGIYLEYQVAANKNALYGISIDGKKAETRWYDPFHYDQNIPSEKKAGGKGYFAVFEKIPYNPSTVAQQMLTAGEASKSGQFAEGVGMETQKQINMLQDLDTEENSEDSE